MNGDNIEALVGKLEQSAMSERALGNHTAADTFAAKARALRRKYSLACPEVKEQSPEEKVAELRAAFIAWLDSIPSDAEVVVDDPVGGMQRTMPLRVVIEDIKSGSLLLIKTVDPRYAWPGPYREYQFVVQEVAPPLPAEGNKFVFFV